jgi:hypothetical protein
VLGVPVMLAFVAAPAEAQRLVEGSVGFEGTVGRFGQIEETPFGFTARMTVDVGRRVGVEAAWVRFPEKRGGSFGERIWLVGARVRVWQADSRLYLRARAGRIFFAGALFATAFPTQRHPAFDLGATLEDDLTPNFVWRLEAGDLIVPLGGIEYFDAGPPRILRTTHNLMSSTGVALRF